MAIQGEPDAELKDLLAEIDAIQMAARKPIRAGALGSDIYASADELLRRSANGNLLEFVAHGMGLISHEAPRLTDVGPVPYPPMTPTGRWAKAWLSRSRPLSSIRAADISNWRTRSPSQTMAGRRSAIEAADGTEVECSHWSRSFRQVISNP